MNPVFEASNFSINQMAKGVLPVPPTFKLPMTNEGTDAFVDLKIPTENKKCRMSKMLPNRKEKGQRVALNKRIGVTWLQVRLKMRIEEVISHLEQWAPPILQESYDNSGLLVGNKQNEITNVLVSLDCTEDIVEEPPKLLDLKTLMKYHDAGHISPEKMEMYLNQYDVLQ